MTRVPAGAHDIRCPLHLGKPCPRGTDCLENGACIERTGDRRPARPAPPETWTTEEWLRMAVAYRAMADGYETAGNDDMAVYCDMRADQAEEKAGINQ